jgi:uncharacterized coiled-coil protein SlyX
MKWKKLMLANGFDVNSYSKTIQNLVKKYEELDYQNKELLKEVKSAPNEQIDEIENNLSDIQDLLNDLDAEICKKVEVYDRNRETYAKLGEKLKDSRRGPKGKTKMEEPIELPNEPHTDLPLTPEAETLPLPEEPKKKSGGGGLIVLGIIALVGGIIGVNLLRKK